MDFEIGHLDMITQNDHLGHQLDHHTEPRQNQTSILPQSLILNEMQKEIDDLQNKLRLNNRRLLLFETENNKLIEEKNKFFFEMQNAMEKHQLIVEKINSLENENSKYQSENELLQEKNQSVLQINQVQLAELKRFTKFHLKIQNVIKPYIQQLKLSVEKLSQDLLTSKNQNESLTSENLEFSQKLQKDQAFYSDKILSLELDKNQTITCYEEQIHSFSKEIVRLEQQNDDFSKEIGRLKKAVEFKNYFENELIKFKRVHENDQREILLLNEKLNSVCVKLMEKEQDVFLSAEKLKSIEISFQSNEQILETTRQQLTKQIDHSTVLTERLARLEKLNLNLSQQMQPMN